MSYAGHRLGLFEHVELLLWVQVTQCGDKVECLCALFTKFRAPSRATIDLGTLMHATELISCSDANLEPAFVL